MLSALTHEADYLWRSLRLGRAFAFGGFIHCNVQVTYRCGFRCTICDFWKDEHRAADELSLEQMRRLAMKLRKLGSLIVSLAGGEPLIRSDLPEIAKIFAEAGHFPILITNGWHMTPEKARDLFAAGVQEISVSVDYADPAKHDAMRGCPGAWLRATQALKMLLAERTDRRRRVHLITVLMDDNLDEIEPLIQLSKSLGVTCMVNLYSCNRGCKTARLPDGKVSAHLLKLKQQYPEFISLTSYLERFDEAIAQGGIGPCRAGRLLLNIDDKGNVARCTEMLDRPVGSLLTTPMAVIAKRLATQADAEPCAACWTSCRGFAESMYVTPRARQLKEFLVSVKPR